MTESIVFEATDIHRPDLLGPMSLRLTAGTITTLYGPSGSGKSLLLRCLADLDPHAGTMAVDGVDSRRVSAPTWRKRVAYVPAEPGWWDDVIGDHFPDGDHAPLLERLGFDEQALDWTTERASSGERQRLAIARVIAMAPTVLLLDESTANLDDDNARIIETIIKEWVTGASAWSTGTRSLPRARNDNDTRAGLEQVHQRAVLWVSHSAEQRDRLGDRRLHIEAGRLDDLPGGDAA